MKLENESTFEKEIARIDRRLAAMSEVEEIMTMQGYGLGDFDLDTMTDIKLRQWDRDEQLARPKAEQQAIIDATNQADSMV